MTLEDSLAAIDAVNGGDPRLLRGRPKALVEGELVTEWVRRLRPDASDALVLAARAHHLRRWELARTDYPEGRAGYLRWRRDQKQRHAAAVAEVLEGRGVAPAVVERVQQLVRKEGLGTDPEAQTLEDAICLVFLETQLTELADDLADDDKTVEILRRTLPKMSAEAKAAATGLDLDQRAADLLRAAAG